MIISEVKSKPRAKKRGYDLDDRPENKLRRRQLAGLQFGV